MNKKINEKCKLEKMDVEEFRKYGKEVIDYICQYGTNIEERDVAPTLDPGYLKKLLPGEHAMRRSVKKSKTRQKLKMNIEII